MTVSLVIRGRPVPLQRSRTSSGRHYLPARSKTYRLLVQAEWMAAGRPSLGDAPFAMSARFYGARANADLDNLVKAILDALNGLAFADDRQLTCLSGCHKLPVDDRGPRAEIDLWAARQFDLAVAA
ncbi:MAG: RusA family crossover junction endodeoxyribonuclease [Solirubrobacteraceae bacterium]